MCFHFVCPSTPWPLHTLRAGTGLCCGQYAWCGFPQENFLVFLSDRSGFAGHVAQAQQAGSYVPLRTKTCFPLHMVRKKYCSHYSCLVFWDHLSKFHLQVSIVSFDSGTYPVLVQALKNSPPTRTRCTACAVHPSWFLAVEGVIFST